MVALAARLASLASGQCAYIRTLLTIPMATDRIGLPDILHRPPALR